MSKMEFTPAQQDAINAYGGSVIVSAAAGSGKTRVLVQRVISLLTDSEHPVDADRMLIVTFTKAAAEEMRARNHSPENSPRAARHKTAIHKAVALPDCSRTLKKG